MSYCEYGNEQPVSNWVGKYQIQQRESPVRTYGVSN
jgi:hypothetical protein